MNFFSSMGVGHCVNFLNVGLLNDNKKVKI